MRVKVGLLWLFLIIMFSLDANPVIGLGVGDPAPDFTLVDIDGNSFTLSTCPAEIVLIDFFATWCSPCVAEIPELRSVYGEYSRNQLEIISIGSDDEAALWNFAEEHNMIWVVAQDTNKVSDKYKVLSIPTLFIIDARCYIQYTHVGKTEETSASNLMSEINILLSGTGNGDPNGDSDTGLPYTLIAFIVIGVIVFLIIGIVIAGQLLGWSEAPKKRHPRKRPRKRRR